MKRKKSILKRKGLYIQNTERLKRNIPKSERKKYHKVNTKSGVRYIQFKKRKGFLKIW
jgi:hypothetical protein